MALRIAVFGTGEFALPTFRALMESERHKVVGAYTQPDRTGRGHHRHVNKVKELAEQHGVPVFQPEKINKAEALEELRGLAADVFIVAAYGQILKPEFLAMPRLGAFNLHGSLLPRHRGAAPVQYSIWKGDQQAGVTIFQIEPALDSGPMIGKVATDIGPKETSGELMTRLADLSVDLTFTALDQLEAGTAVFETQDESLVTLAKKIQKEDGLIDWGQSAQQVDCHVRAMQPWPKASTFLYAPDRKPLRCIVTQAKPLSSSATSTTPAGRIITEDKRLLVQTGHGLLEIEMIQPEGKKPMDAAGFLNGYGIKTNANFGNAPD